jgi:hypothetical protein
MASDYIQTKKQWNDLRRTLLYGRTEVRFYQEIIPLLIKKGFSITRAPRCHVAEYNLDGLVSDDSVAWNDDTSTMTLPTLEDSTNSGSFLVLDSMDIREYYQESPLSTQQAIKCLEAVAHLHAAAWEDVELLEHADQRMARGSYHLSTRNPKELQDIQESWNHFVTEFGDENPTLFSQPNIQNLGRRMYNMAEYVSEQLTLRPTDPHATLTHGDFKAMNVFLPTSTDNHAVMIDFASTGVGCGMSDVAMHVMHAVSPTKSGNDELSLVEGYLNALEVARVQYNTSQQPYPRDVAMRHYRLACVDYMRFIMGRFWKSSTKESFEKTKDSKNVTLVNRDLNAAMAWIAKVDKYLQEFEEDKAAAENN